MNGQDDAMDRANSSSSNMISSYTYRDELALAEHFAAVLEHELAGRTRPRLVDAWPKDVCQVCVLPPPLEPPTEEDASGWAEPDRHRGAVGARSDQADEEPRDGAQGPLRRSPSNLGLEFVVHPTDGKVTLDLSVSFAFYTRHYPSHTEQKDALELVVAGSDAPSSNRGKEDERKSVTLADVFQRNQITTPSIRVELEACAARQVSWHSDQIQREIDRCLKAAAAAPDAYRGGRAISLPIAILKDEATYKAFLSSRTETRPEEPREVAATVEVRARASKEGLHVACYLRNLTPSSGKAMADNCRLLADAQMQVSILHGDLVPVELLPMPRDYQFDRRVWGLGHGTSVFVSDDRKLLSSQGIGFHHQPRISARTHASTAFSELAESPLLALEDVRRSMEKYWRKWEDEVLGKDTLRLSPDALRQCKEDHVAFRFEIDLFASGIAALKSDERLLLSFQAMNRVFGRLSEGKYHSWRLFQIVFLVAQLPSLVIREGIRKGEHPDGQEYDWGDALDRADVLWFPTGGGKTEAYMGLVSCACLYDRLRGKDFGVTAWLRFPLRMLSVQQLQRAMKMIWETEVERQALLGTKASSSDPISLGYFVGKSSTPNWLDAQGLRALEDEEAANRIRVIADCPACGKKSSVRISVDVDALRLKHVCSECQTELPLYIVDDEIYRYLPSLLVGTVDKAATVSFQANFALLWGAASWRCPTHGFFVGTTCRRCRQSGANAVAAAESLIRVAPYDASPSFHIQDELHLLQEELGAFAGHYETLLQYCESALGGRRPKILAATATIEGYERHARHLYGSRTVVRFPGRGFDRYNTFYTEKVCSTKGDASSSDIARIFMAIRPASMNHVTAAGRCAEIMLEEIARLSKDLKSLIEFLPDCDTLEGALLLLVQYSTLLSYVGSLRNGARTNAQLKRRSLDLRADAQRELLVEFHSSRSTVSQLSELIEQAQNPPPWKDESFLDAIIATDVISHGVDLERINLMTMDAIPEEIGRYIQISSRCGRTHVGLVVGVLPHFSRRATSIFHRFREFHNNLEVMINPVPINRFAKNAITRTAPGILAGIMLGRVNPIVEGDLRLRRLVTELLDNEGFQLPNAKKPFSLLDEAAAAYAMGQGIYPQALEESFMRSLRLEVERFCYLVRASQEQFLFHVLNPKPMTSLRDVGKGIPFAPDADSLEDAVWFSNAKGG